MDNTNTQNVSDGNENQTQGASGAEGQKDKVDYETYSRLMKQHKKNQEVNETLLGELKVLKEKVNSFESSKAESTGDWKAIAENHKKRIVELEEQNKAIVEDFTWKSLKQNFVSTLKEEGCLDPELLYLEARATNKLKGIEVNKSDFTFDKDSLSSLVTDYKKGKAHLFTKTVQAPNDRTPKQKEMPVQNEMEKSTDQLKKELGIM